MGGHMLGKSTNLQRAQLSDALHPFSSVAKSSPPGGGWVRAIRESLGMTQAQLAARVRVSRQAVQEFESAEAKRRITLDSLDRLAAAMGCRMVYALVPVDATIDSMREAQARAQAEKMMGPVSHSMAMESQAVPSGIRQRQLQILMEELQAGSARNLWK
jgi:predicted DNA-binding mobile mystery protein A